MTEPLSNEPQKAFLNTVRAGEVRTGRVIGVEDREVLVELDGFPGPGSAVGCIPHGDLTRKAAGHPSEVVSIGQQLTFEVIGVDRRQERVWASTAACEDPALRAFLLGLRRGATHQGQVASVHNFGVFVNLDGEPDQCTGFIRLPELSWRSFDHPADVVTAGQRVAGEDGAGVGDDEFVDLDALGVDAEVERAAGLGAGWGRRAAGWGAADGT
ncbi:S1 RNA-binding domain-containing protein [Streptomyces anulatus]|uniref:S1 RNA-binding domain-containing protein n=1 Tax=Streptomyces anulatus TaxID=1892 RepID=UPI003F4CB8EA